MIKKCFAMFIAIALFVSIIPSTFANAAKPIKVYMDGGKIHFQTAPIIKNNRTFVEMRPIFETAGIKLHWDQSTQTVTGKKDGTTIKLTLENKNSLYQRKSRSIRCCAFCKKQLHVCSASFC